MLDEKDIDMWKQRIRRSIGYQQRTHQNWRDAINLYTGRFFDEDPWFVTKNAQKTQLIHSYVKNLVPAVYFRDPKIFVRTEMSKFQEFVELMEQTINYLWRPEQLNLKSEIKHCILDAALLNLAWVKVGYTAEFGEEPIPQEETKQRKFLEDLKDFVKGTISEIKGEEKGRERQTEEGKVIEFNERIDKEAVFAKRISPWKMLVPQGYRFLHEMPYVMEIIELPKEEVKNFPLLKEADTIPGIRLAHFTFTRIDTHQDKQISSRGADPEAEICTLYEIWDKRSQKRYIFAEGTKIAHYEGDWPYDIEGFPYELLRFNETPETNMDSNFYTISPVLVGKSQAIEHAKFRTYVINHIKKQESKGLVQKGTLTPAEINAINNAEDMSIIPIEANPRLAVEWMPNAPLVTDFWRIMAEIKIDFQEATGIAQLFAPASPEETATKSQIRMVAQNLRGGEVLDCVELFTQRVGFKLSGLIWQMYSRDTIAEITGRVVDERNWPEPTRHLIQRAYSLRIDAGSMRPPTDEAIEREQWLREANLIAAAFPNRINQDVFLTQLLKKMGHKDLELLVKKGDEEEIAVAQQENQFLLQGIPVLRHPNDNDELHLKIHSQIAQQRQPLVDKHIAEHFEAQQMKMGGQPQAQKRRPQQGDMNFPGQEAAPELSRKGTPAFADLMGQSVNLGEGLGGNV